VGEELGRRRQAIASRGRSGTSRSGKRVEIPTKSAQPPNTRAVAETAEEEYQRGRTGAGWLREGKAGLFPDNGERGRFRIRRDGTNKDTRRG
jgi:hypothetical protein